MFKYERAQRLKINKDRLFGFLEDISNVGNRFAGSEGEKLAASFLEKSLKGMGMETRSEEFQYMHYEPVSAQGIILSPLGEAVSCKPLLCSRSGKATGNLVYVGQGLAEQFKFLRELGVDFKGKIVLVSGSHAFLSYGLAEQYGAVGYVAITDVPLREDIRMASGPNDLQPGAIPGITVSASTGEYLLTLLNAGDILFTVECNGQFTEKKSKNICGAWRPKNSYASDERILVCAHYDTHFLGPGVHDNASGCATVLEIAAATKNLDSKYGIEFVFFGVEEIGLCWGSNSYVASHLADIAKIKAVLAIDGAGSSLCPLTFIESSCDIRDFAVAIAKKLSWEFNEIRKPSPTTDHYSFAKHGVPVIWAGDLPYTPFYHTNNDTIEWMSKDRLADLAELMGTYAIALCGGTAKKNVE